MKLLNYNKIKKLVKKHYIIIIIILLICLITMPFICKHFELFTPSFTTYKVDPSERKILMLYVGGTIGMVESKSGYVPKKGYLEQQLTNILKIHPKSKIIADFHIKEYSPLLDSSNMSLKNWNQIINDIKDNYDKYSAFIVIHGTDTMAYSASAVSFALENLNKPVIFTGSQIPLQRIRNDGQNNLIASLVLASNYSIPAVMIVFAGLILRGDRSSKISPNKLLAFESRNAKPIGSFGYSELPILNLSVLPKPAKKQNISIQLYNLKYQVIIFLLTPGVNLNVLKNIANYKKIHGIIMLTFGIGDGPTSNPVFINTLNYLRDNNIYVVNISQTGEGMVDQTDYATGTALSKAGVISGADMTMEAAYCKLLFIFSKYGNKDRKIVVKKMGEELAGEMSSHLLLSDVSPLYK